ncbi:MAG: hypothetical protein Q8K64_16690 [Sediminibacterium sp.]|nr:hypothetical protein [Sediminibacterium sp.]
MNNNHQFVAGLLLGALAGTALALYLNSDKGKQFLADFELDTANLKQDVNEHLDEAHESLQDVLAKAKQLVADLEQKMERA